MSEPLRRAEPVPSAPFSRAGLMIQLEPPMARFSVRARNPEAVEAMLGVKVPRKIGAMVGGIACLGPDEWLYRAAGGVRITPGDGQYVAVTDISERSVCLAVDGPRASQIIMSGCPLDLDKFPVGRATRTIYENVEIILLHQSDSSFQIEVWRSFAPWLWTALTTASYT